ncbi:hypothetical protein SAMN05428944_0246 [Streptomyces sp. 1222.5]|uniref:hypothetical protein n=1 Tax=unclassified Streptomyces TaxID=2593676 RepID=UPI00089C54A6|nr:MULTISPECIES: hypothetical protein [unclassified Streptomyces]PKW12480.1 hypothetical protein BX260_7847 [Streptomyces sp. 5112.2]SEB55639.1 hypothetical protein SAMN05428944_0246 [Streptomyces sp. 1222.5]
MGVYVVSVAAQDWSRPGEDGYGDVAAALNTELERRALPPYELRQAAREAPGWFEEKVSQPMDGFVALCRTRLTDAELSTLLDWSVLVPFTLEEEIVLPVGTAYSGEETAVAGAPQVLALAERLADAVALPVDAMPAGDNLALSLWFLQGGAEWTARVRPGAWVEDRDAAFYVALYLRAAQYSLRYGCPMTYS